MIYYKNWLTRIGQGIQITPLYFTGNYINPATGSTRIYYIDDVGYYAQLWMCRMSDGTQKELKFRFIAEQDEGNVGWNYNRVPAVIDTSPDTITCTKQEYENGSLLQHNYEDTPREAKNKEVLNQISSKNTKYSIGAFYLLRYIQSPTSKTLHDWKNWKYSNPALHVQLEDTRLSLLND